MAIRVLQVGLGPIGAAVGRQVAERAGFTLVGGVDVDPLKVGRRLSEAIGMAGVRGAPAVAVSDDLMASLKKLAPDVVSLCTSSSLKQVMPQIEAILKARRPIVSTTEELAYPWRSHRALAKKIDELAKKAKVAVLGTGVNPGFAMDALPLALSAACQRVDRVRVDRIQDARTRRLPFQQKIGSGLSGREFQERVEDGRVRHVGFAQSVAMIADAFGWRLDRIADTIEPKLATEPIASEFIIVAPAYVCGIVQDGVGYKGGEAVIHLHMEAYLGAPESYDAVTIEGAPRLHMKIDGGLPGDSVTASVVVNMMAKVLAAEPGLRTMRDVGLPSWHGGR